MTLYALPSYRMTPRSFIYGPNRGVNQTGTPNTKAYERQQKKNRNITIASILTGAALLFLGGKTKAGRAIISKLKTTKFGDAVSNFCQNSKAVQWIKGIPGKIKGLFSKAPKAAEVLTGTVEDATTTAATRAATTAASTASTAASTAIKVEPLKRLPAPAEVLRLPAPSTVTSEAGDTLIRNVDDIANNPPAPRVIHLGSNEQLRLMAPKTITSEAGDTFTDGAGI